MLTQPKEPLIPLTRYSSFNHLRRITAWVFRFIHNCRKARSGAAIQSSLTASELQAAERYWLLHSQTDCYAAEIAAIETKRQLPTGSNLISLCPFMGMLRVGGRQGNSTMAYAKIHPIILHGKHPITKLLIKTEHIRLLHAGPTLLSASIGRRSLKVTSQDRPCVFVIPNI